MAIQDYKVSESYSGRDVSSLPNKPNQNGFSAEQLKARFDQLGKEVIPQYNDLIDFLNTNLFSGGSTEGHTHNIDNIEDGVTNKLFTSDDNNKLDGIQAGAEVNQNAYSSIKVGSSTSSATSKTDTFEIVPGLNIVAVLDTVNKKLTLSATGDIATEASQSLVVDVGGYYTGDNVEDVLQEIGLALSSLGGDFINSDGSNSNIVTLTFSNGTTLTIDSDRQIADLTFPDGTTANIPSELWYSQGKATEDINEGDNCMFAGSQGSFYLIKKAVASELASNPHLFAGVATKTVLANNFIKVTRWGLVNNIDTNGWVYGTKVYFDPVTLGFTDTMPSLPNARLYIGMVVAQGTSNGILLVDCQDLTRYSNSEIDTFLATKQATLVNQTNIKSINGSSILGSGDLEVISGQKLGSATVDPLPTNDTTQGYSVGSIWINTSTDVPFICTDSTTNFAIWVDLTKDMSTVKRYGFKRERANSDPNTRITYIYDAVGFAPAFMDYVSGNFDYGDWKSLISEIVRPVMLKNDGTVDYELSRDDMTKKSDGITNSDVSNTAYAGNAMIEFRKFKWVYRYSDATYDYVIFSNVQYDANYKAYAHQNALGSVKDAFYWGAFKGSNISSKLRSIADQTIMVNQTRNTEVSYANAIGSGYHTIYKSGWDFINDLLTLVSRSDDSQTKFGAGRSSSSNSSALATGTLKKMPMFKGYTDATSDVKVFGIEGFWGNVWEGMAGLVYNGGIKTKMTPGYNFDGSGYNASGVVPSGTSGGYVSSAQSLTDQGYVPSVSSGSASTYFCDGLWFNTGQVDYALVGGSWATGLLAGGRSVALSLAASSADVDFGSRLSYLNPA